MTAYGKQILATLSQELTGEFGQAFSLRSLYRAIQLHQHFPGLEIVSTLSAQLGWSHFGLTLCASADVEQVELLQLDAKSIRVSEYLTELPPLPLLRARLHQAIEHAREIAARGLPATEDKIGTAQ